MIQDKHLKIFQALASQTRLNIIEILLKESSNVTEISNQLNLSQVIVTRHLTQLEEAGIVTTSLFPGKRGNQRLCSIAVNSINIDFKTIFEENKSNSEKLAIPIGSYIDYQVSPSCGLANKNKIIGLPDNPKYFSSPDRYNAGILWFSQGWVTYNIPSYLFSQKEISGIEISLELCSEYPFYNNNFPSDIYFYINDIFLGLYCSPGDFGDRKGLLTPKWWNMGSEYGTLQKIVINEKGTFIDGVKISELSINTLNPFFDNDLEFKISCPKDTKHPGGINIFGKNFGDYDQDIVIEAFYK